MAADKTAAYVATVTLQANTPMIVNLTAAGRRTIELLHHGNVVEPVYYDTESTEGALRTGIAFGIAVDELSVLLPGERLTLNRADVRGAYIKLISAGAVRVTIDGNT